MNNKVNLTKKVELLSPVGSFEGLKCAVYNGADAVYLGLENFNARGNIENFTMENLKDATTFAHMFGVKVYLTLNTLVKDEEFENVIDYVKNALKSRVDAFIVQDIGLIYYLRQHFPNIELHASTQMGLNNLEGVNALKDLGFSRVVLARETPLSEIKRIKENSSVDIEYFVQGALCVSFSGNCYLCSLLTGASGNRGKCKQFCRLPFSASIGDEHRQGYLLSTKDFCLLPKLKQLLDSGVTSLKIEGRARRPAYVAVATGIYRKALDNGFKYNDDDILKLKKVYNRGNFTLGYFTSEKIIYPYVQNHMGIKIGEVIDFSKGKKFNIITIKSNYDIKKGDVIKFIKNQKEVGVISAVDIKKEEDIYKLSTTSVLPYPCQANLIVDSHLESDFLNNKRYIDVDVTLSLRAGERARVTMSAKDVKDSFTSVFLTEEAKTLPITYEECKSQFNKMGDYFRLKNFVADLGNVFLTKAQLNGLRREGIELLKEKLIENYEKTNKIQEKSQFFDKKWQIIDKKQIAKDMIVFDDFDKVELSQDKIFIYAPNLYGDNIKALYQEYKDQNIFISLPIMASEGEIEKVKDILEYCQNWGVVANNYWALELKDRDKTIIGSSLNVFNSYAIKYYADRGYKNIILSIEEHSNIKNSGVNLYEYASFYPEYMYFRHCPFIEHFNSSCDKCKFNNNLVYNLNGEEFVIKRQKIISCQFVLKAKKRVTKVSQENVNKIYEM